MIVCVVGTDSDDRFGTGGDHKRCIRRRTVESDPGIRKAGDRQPQMNKTVQKDPVDDLESVEGVEKRMSATKEPDVISTAS